MAASEPLVSQEPLPCSRPSASMYGWCPLDMGPSATVSMCASSSRCGPDASGAMVQITFSRPGKTSWRVTWAPIERAYSSTRSAMAPSPVPSSTPGVTLGVATSRLNSSPASRSVVMLALMGASY